MCVRNRFPTSITLEHCDLNFPDGPGEPSNTTSGLDLIHPSLMPLAVIFDQRRCLVHKGAFVFLAFAFTLACSASTSSPPHDPPTPPNASVTTTGAPIMGLSSEQVSLVVGLAVGWGLFLIVISLVAVAYFCLPAGTFRQLSLRRHQHGTRGSQYVMQEPTQVSTCKTLILETYLSNPTTVLR